MLDPPGTVMVHLIGAATAIRMMVRLSTPWPLHLSALGSLILTLHDLVPLLPHILSSSIVPSFWAIIYNSHVQVRDGLVPFIDVKRHPCLAAEGSWIQREWQLLLTWYVVGGVCMCRWGLDCGA